jgi:spoIIIJ-associated protein
MTSVSEHQCERGQVWLAKLLALAGISAQVSSKFVEAAEDSLPIGTSDASVWLAIESKDLSDSQINTLIGPKGQGIDSLQYLANLLLNLHQGPEEQFPFTVDIDDYRARRFGELQSLAQTAVEQVRQVPGEYELKSLSSAERRQVHSLLKDYPDIETYSRGREPDRRLVVRSRDHDAQEPPYLA